MNPTITTDQAAAMLRAARPTTPDMLGLDARALHDLQRITQSAPTARTSSKTPRRAAYAAGLVTAAVAVIAAGVVAWPNSDTPAATAFAVTRPTPQTVLLTIDGRPDAAAMQQALNAAGVPAAVLPAAQPGTCSDTAIAAQAPGAVANGPNGVGSPSELGTTITPSLIPTGDLVLIVISDTGSGNSTTSTRIIDAPAPTCADLG